MIMFEVTLPPPSRKTKVRAIIKEEAENGGVDIEVLLKPGRRGTVNTIAVRHKAMYRARSETGLPYKTLGKLFYRHHATVIHGYRKYKEKLDVRSL